MEKVIFREDKDIQGGYIAIFPEDCASRDGYGAVAFHFIGEDHNKVIFEPYMEISYGYMLEQKIVHKNDKRIPELIQTLEAHWREYGMKFKAYEKITDKMNKKRLEWYYNIVKR